MKMFNKSRIAWTISALFLLAVTSCSKDEPAVQSPSAGQILFTGEQAGLTVKSALIANNSDFVADAGSTLKTTLHDNITWWTITSDKTGIYSTEANTAPSNGGTTGIVNKQYSASTSGPSSDFTPLTAMYWGGVAGTSHHFYAYYPFTAGNPEAATVPVGLLSTQFQSAANDYTHIGALDFLVATPVTVVSPDNTSPTGNSVHLTYNHLFTIVEFDITGSGTIWGIRLSGTGANLALDGTIAITQSTPLPGAAYTVGGSFSNTVIVKLAASATLTSTPTKVYMVICPGFTGTCSIDFSSVAALSTWRNPVTPAKVAPAGGFLRGQYYTVTVDAGAL